MNNEARLQQAFNIAELRVAARRRVPRMVFDYIDGGADDEITLRANSERFRAYELSWRVPSRYFHAVDCNDGVAIDHSLARCPTATQRLFDPSAGEIAVARAAAAAGMIRSLSTLATTTLEAVAGASVGPKWFQLYVWKDRGLMREMLERAMISLCRRESRRGPFVRRLPGRAISGVCGPRRRCARKISCMQFRRLAGESLNFSTAKSIAR